MAGWDPVRYPEKDKQFEGGFWWPRNTMAGIETRINVLHELIKTYSK